MRTYQRALLFTLFIGCLLSLSYIEEPQRIQPEVIPVDDPQVRIDKLPQIGFSETVTRQLKCLADNIYNEAGNQGYYGMKAVGLVTMNRVNHDYFPKDICDVVYQKTKNMCQFSWVCQTKRVKIDEQLYSLATIIAARVFLNYDQLDDITNGAIFFHADYVNPAWKNVVKTVKIGNHIFYKRGNSNDDAKTKSANEGGQHKARLLLADGRN